MFLFVDIDLAQTQDLPLGDLWCFLPIGYLLTILIETPILVVGLPSKISLKQKLLCGVWLTACTYPIVILVLPAIFLGEPRWIYLTVAEIFAPAAECVLFWIVFRDHNAPTSCVMVRCLIVVVLANLASFGIGDLMNYYGWFGLF